ncbi:MAG: FtsX-like permease family protein [Acidobacteria bacterium]|nr:FtsX-like permease family protein [Acidobacteriota bacterium]
MRIDLWLDELRMDARAALRALRASRAQSLVIIVYLTLGIGGTGAVLSLYSALMLRQPPVTEPDRLVTIWRSWHTDAGRAVFDPLSWSDYSEIASRARSLSGVAGYVFGGETSIQIDDHATRVASGLVTANYFDVLGITASAGRFLTSTETDPREAPAFMAVVSHRLAHERFRSGAAALGQIVHLRGNDYTVVGVAPPAFLGTVIDAGPVDLWLPISRVDDVFVGWGRIVGSSFDGNTGLSVYNVARIADGSTRATVQAELDALTLDLAPDPAGNEAAPKLAASHEVRRHPRDSEQFVASARFAGAIATLVLVVAVVNVASLYLGSTLRRGREAGVRMAIGSPSRRFVQQSFAEAFILSTAGAIGALAMLWGGGRFLIRLAPYWPAGTWGDERSVFDAAPDSTVFLAVLAICLLVVPAIAVGAARAAVRASPLTALKGGRQSRPNRRTARALAVLQLALTVVLAGGAGLLVRSWHGLATADPGFAPENLIVADIFLDDTLPSDADAAATLREMTTRLQAFPEIEIAAHAARAPGGAFTTASLSHAGGAPISALVNVATPGFLDATGMRLLSGTGLTGAAGDILINQTLADALAGAGDLIGSHIGVERGEPFQGTFDAQIVGIVGDTIDVAPGRDPEPAILVPYSSYPGFLEVVPRPTLLIKTKASPTDLAFRNVREVVEAESARVFALMTGKQWLRWYFAREERLALYGLAFAGIAAALALLGVYATLSRHWRARRAEIGVRVAVGASPQRILALVISDAGRLAVAGLTLGGVAALFAFRGISAWIHDIPASDPVTIASVTALVLGSVLAISILPAWRASREDPLDAIRRD